MNKKGFTMVEILVTVIILGILSTMAIAGYSKYVDWTRLEGYQVMAHSAKQAAENYIMEHPGDVGVAELSSNARYSGYYMSNKAIPIPFQTLVNLGYLKKTVDPMDDSRDCKGGVRVGTVSSASEHVLDLYVVLVDLCCSNYQKQYVYTYTADDFQPLEKLFEDKTLSSSGASEVTIRSVCSSY